MAKKTGGQNPVDEAYLRSLMAGGPSEPLSSPAPSRIADLTQPFMWALMISLLTFRKIASVAITWAEISMQ